MQLTTTTTFYPVTTTTTTFYPAPPVQLEPTNECDVITIFPMGVECVSVDPSFVDTYDGSASLYVTGGTPPYSILWDNGSVGSTIGNLGVGSYLATVTDSYGDFLINSTCILSAETPSPATTTTSTTTLPQFEDLCMVIIEQSNSQFIDFIYNGYFDGKPSWLSNDNQYFVYWNTGTTGEWLVSGITTGVIYNPNPALPPLTGWSYLGGGSKTISVLEGSCGTIPPLTVQISKNNSSCIEDGSIIINASGGVPPYTYSKDGGVSYQTNPIFNNLAAGNYSIYIQDSIGTIQTQLVTITSNTPQTIYNIQLINVSNNLSVNITPPLPNGVSVVFDLVFNTTFKVAPSPLNANYVGNINLLINGSPYLPAAPIITNSTTVWLPCSGLRYNTDTSLVWSNITLNNTSTFSGLITNTITPILPSPACYTATSNYTVNINNLKIQGCNCCNVLSIQSPNNSVQIG